MSEVNTCNAFAGTKRLASGALVDVAAAASAELKRNPAASILIFDDATARPIDVDLRGSAKDVARRLAAISPENVIATGVELGPRGPGRPKLGVVAREVTLLPRHWEWLAEQPGGASVALRKLVEAARKTSPGSDRRRLAQEAANRFMTAMAGNEPGFEEATRALFAGDAEKFAAEMKAWPDDIRSYAMQLAEPAFAVKAA
ncbi:MAG: DUF2239 family protein [Hyphomicrobiaceae bacterium]|nr:DUF2239 family protein [Hyphomicrobiaceae bacterium]